MSLGSELQTFEGPPPTPPAPTYRLFTPWGIAWTTFFWSPIAGSILLAINHRRAGNRVGFWVMLGLGLLVSALLAGALVVVSAQVPAVLLPILAASAMYGLSRWLQGPLLERHASRGGDTVSDRKVIGAAVIAAIITLLVAAVIYSATTDYSHLYQHSRSEQIWYSGDATRADARALGEALDAMAMFGNESEKTAFLRKDGSAGVVTLITSFRDWEREPHRTQLRRMATRLARDTKSDRLTLRMANGNLRILAETTVP